MLRCLIWNLLILIIRALIIRVDETRQTFNMEPSQEARPVFDIGMNRGEDSKSTKLPTSRRADFAPFTFKAMNVRYANNLPKFAATANNSSNSECIRRLAFFHVPKAGGRALQNAIANLVKDQLQINEDEQAVGVSELGAPRADADPMRSQEGKYPYVVEFHTQQPRARDLLSTLRTYKSKDGCPVITATMLRDPLRRAVSKLNYDMETGCLPHEAAEHADLWYEHFAGKQHKFLFRDDCVACGEFWQTERQPELQKTQCQDLSDAEMQEEIQLLHSIDVVGTTENMGAFAKEVAKKMGLRPIQEMTVPKGGATKVSTDDTIEAMSSDTRDAIRAHSQKDMELYEIAKELEKSFL